ncbi:MAG: aminotransferase class I/II-fold pyridoxal phosphate-dependent enzyme, partial [bacterium]|nr:aminotransferase class I/II-fold pyridoxal phosphate-dependent enzyme [bacterium]
MKNTKKLFSKMAQNVIPYQWETGVSKEMLRFDTNTLANPPPAVNSLIRQLENNCSINEYNDPSYSKLKQLIANYEGVTPENITITNSGDEALDVLAKTFLNPNDLFIIQPPTYEMFKLQCVINNGQAIEVPLNINDFSINKISLLKTIKEKPIKITFICNPNNQTGTVYSHELIVK